MLIVFTCSIYLNGIFILILQLFDYAALLSVPLNQMAKHLDHAHIHVQ